MSVDNLRKRIEDAKTGKNEPVESPIVTKVEPTIKLTAGELRDACKQCSNHEHSPIFQKSVEGFSDDHEVVIERADLEAMLDDKKVVRRRQRQNGQIIERKQLVEKGTSPQKKSTPPQKPKSGE